MKLSREFYERPTLDVAKDLLGKHLVFYSPEGVLIGEINEVESYLGEDDEACHAHAGKTKRTAPLYLSGGHSYVYFIYGMYYCLNVVAEPKDCPAAILIRSVIPIKGLESKKTDGPGKLCRSFGITLKENALDLTTSERLYIEDVGKKIKTFETTKRIGITKATDKLWRFVYQR